MMHYKIHYFKSLTSTQDKAKEFSKQGLSNIVIISDSQTKSRGRFKRKWHSSKGGLWMSILLKPKNIKYLQHLTFAAAISVVESVKKITGINANIKWPNDVHYKNRKLCGILTEGIFGKENYVVVGIGLNVNQNLFPYDIQDIATSLKLIKNKKIDIGKLTKLILTSFFKLYNDYYNKNKSGDIIQMWKKYSDTISQNLTVITKTKKICGKAVGVDENCNLLLKLENNKIIKIVEGDVKVRY